MISIWGSYKVYSSSISMTQQGTKESRGEIPIKNPIADDLRKPSLINQLACIRSHRHGASPPAVKMATCRHASPATCSDLTYPLGRVPSLQVQQGSHLGPTKPSATANQLVLGHEDLLSGRFLSPDRIPASANCEMEILALTSGSSPEGTMLDDSEPQTQVAERRRKRIENCVDRTICHR